MNVLIAANSYKGFASSIQIGEWLMSGIKSLSPDSCVRVLSVADGGEGTVEAILSNKGGDLVEVIVHDPLFRKRTAHFGIFDDGTKTAVIEICQACGFGLLKPEERDTMAATSYGVGEMVKASVAHGVQRIIIALGGCIASDGGVGAAQALGARFLDDKGNYLMPSDHGGFNVRSLSCIHDIDLSDFEPMIEKTMFIMAADVETPLLGENGQAATFGHQKGATSEQIGQIENALSHWNSVLARKFNKSFNVKYAGAAGGLGAGLAAFTSGDLRSGADVVLENTDFKRQLEWADMVVVGEGRLDGTTLLGKSPAVIARASKLAGKRVIGAVGSMERPIEGSLFFDAIFQASDNERQGLSSFDPESIKWCGSEIGRYLESNGL